MEILLRKTHLGKFCFFNLLSRRKLKDGFITHSDITHITHSDEITLKVLDLYCPST